MGLLLFILVEIPTKVGRHGLVRAHESRGQKLKIATASNLSAKGQIHEGE